MQATAKPIQRQGHTPTDHQVRSEKLDTSRIILVGAGGVGSFIAQYLGLLVGVEAILIIDGDTFERKNTDRQGLAAGNIGEDKVDAVAKALSHSPALILTDNQFIDEQNFPEIIKSFQPTLLISAVDNDKARKAIWAHNKDLPILWGANEQWTPQAGLSLPQKPWNPMEAFSPADAAGPGCNIQTVWANATAASMAGMLLGMHASDHEKWDKLPIFLSKSENEMMFQMFANEL